MVTPTGPKGHVLKTMALALAGMVLVFFAVGALLVDSWHVETSLTMKAPPARLVELVGNFDVWEKWSAMKVTLGPQDQRQVTGAPGTVGHKVSWKGREGEAVLSLTKVDADGVHYDYHSQRPGEATMTLAGQGRVTWRTDGGATKVVWFDESSWAQQPLMNRFAGRWIAWFGGIQERVRQIQTSSLQGLQRVAEEPDAVPPVKAPQTAPK